MSKRQLSEETKRKMSETRKKQWADPEYRKKMVQSKETKKKRSETMKGIWKQSKFRMNRIYNYETLKKMSDSGKRKWQDPEYKNKWFKSMCKYWASSKFEENNNKTSKRMKGTKFGPVKHTPETRAKMSKSRRKQWGNKDYRIWKTENARKNYEKQSGAMRAGFDRYIEQRKQEERTE